MVMCTGNTDQMRHAGGAKCIPVDPVNGRLIAHHQSRYQTGKLALLHMAGNAFAHGLPQQCHRMQTGLGQAHRFGV
jgi:hypothetical protein